MGPENIELPNFPSKGSQYKLWWVGGGGEWRWGMAFLCHGPNLF